MTAILKYYKLDPSVKTPRFQTEGSACFDIHAHLLGESLITGYNSSNKRQDRSRVMINGTMSLVILAEMRVLVPTGLIFDIPQGHSVRIHVRSSVAIKKGLLLCNSEGIVDWDYFHEAFIALYNPNPLTVILEHGERLAQGELVPLYDYRVVETLHKPQQKTDRIGGFGSTGTV